MDDTRKALIDYVREQTRIADGDADVMSMELRDIVDSYAMIDFLAFIETTFGIEIADEEVTPETFATLAAAAEFVDRKVKSAA